MVTKHLYSSVPPWHFKLRYGRSIGHKALSDGKIPHILQDIMKLMTGGTKVILELGLGCSGQRIPHSDAQCCTPTFPLHVIRVSQSHTKMRTSLFPLRVEGSLNQFSWEYLPSLLIISIYAHPVFLTVKPTTFYQTKNVIPISKCFCEPLDLDIDGPSLLHLKIEKSRGLNPLKKVT